MIVLYNPPSSATRKPVLPMSLLALGAVLEGQREFTIVDGNLTPDGLGAIDQRIRDDGVSVVAMTVMPGPQLSHAVPLSRALKERHPHVTIVWGGYFPTQHKDACLRAPYVDYVLRGHADLTFPRLLEALESGDRPALAKVPGLARRAPSGETAEHVLPEVPAPDALPDFPYHRVPMERYVRSTFLGRRTLPHHSSYGCPFTCNFCAVVNLAEGRWRAQSAKRTAAVVRRLVRDYGADAVEFYDNNFFVDEARVREFSERIVDAEIGWWGEARIDTLLGYAESTWKLMAESGLRMVFLGAESGSDEVLKRMNKGGTATAEKTIEIARRMAEYGIVPELSFVLGNPPEPVKDTEQTIAFIRRVKRVNPSSEIVLYLYSPVPLAGVLYEEAKASGFRFPETLEEWISPEWQAFSQRRSLSMPWIERSLRRRVFDFERVLNAYYPTSTDLRLRGLRRWILRTVSAWRYHLEVYRYPLELRALHKIMSYQRPETSGF